MGGRGNLQKSLKDLKFLGCVEKNVREIGKYNISIIIKSSLLLLNIS